MSERTTRASYRHALEWLVYNDDMEWIRNGDPVSVGASLVADLFGVSVEKVTADLLRLMNRSPHPFDRRKESAL